MCYKMLLDVCILLEWSRLLGTLKLPHAVTSVMLMMMSRMRNMFYCLYFGRFPVVTLNPFCSLENLLDSMFFISPAESGLGVEQHYKGCYKGLTFQMLQQPYKKTTPSCHSPLANHNERNVGMRTSWTRRERRNFQVGEFHLKSCWVPSIKRSS